jgi:hypothetical protein
MIAPIPRPARHYLVLIAECDRVLALLRKLWLQSATREERQQVWTRIDSVLDERLGLMAGRDRLVAMAEQQKGKEAA